MVLEKIKRFAKRFRAPTDGEKITSLKQRAEALSAQRDKIYADTPDLEQREAKLLEEGKTNKSRLVRKRLASQLLLVRKDLQRQHTTAAMINGQIEILGTDIHNLTLLQQGAMAKLSNSQEITKNAVRAEEILESLSSDAALVSTLEPGMDGLVSQEELDILKEFEEPELDSEELEEDGPTNQEDDCIGYPEASSSPENREQPEADYMRGCDP